MDLILWRHAEAEDGGPDLPDAKRRLTPHGKKQARRIAKWFLEHRPKELRVLVSPTQRTIQTAQALGLPFVVDEGIGPEATSENLIASAGWPYADGAVVLVGHQPTLGRVAAALLSGLEADWSIKKGALWWYANTGRETILRAVLAPELL